MRTKLQRYRDEIAAKTLYTPSTERDSCGVGFVAHAEGRVSHDMVEKAISCVVNLTHRGAVGADKTGDGAGILTQLPKDFFAQELLKLRNKEVHHPEQIAVGQIFFPRDNYEDRERARAIVESVASRYRLKTLGWRHVPVNASVLSEKAEQSRPDIEQIIMVPRKSHVFESEQTYERTLFLVRREIEQIINKESIEDFYICSFSNRTIVYKGLFVAYQLKEFYLDLSNEDFKTSFAIFHQRYSTNTFPDWILAQPFRFLAHNGEINTLKGNTNWMKAREAQMADEKIGDAMEFLRPVIQSGGSDSSALDNVLETFTMAGRDVAHAMMMLVPEAWENMPKMDPDWIAFYNYHACLSEPWDGPAALAFTDGLKIGATLDRNGLRPARYIITKDGFVFMGSEVGLLKIPDSDVAEKGRLGPGKMLIVDPQNKKIIKDFELKSEIIKKRPYKKWVDEEIIPLPKIKVGVDAPQADAGSDLLQRELVFGYNFEELSMVIKPMVLDAKDPVGSMGDDTPIAVLSKKERFFAGYFKQLFAQVTNPPIDPIREELVMSLHTLIGKKRNVLDATAKHAKQIELDTPILFNEELTWIKNKRNHSMKHAVISALFDVEAGPDGLEDAIDDLCEQAVSMVKDGNTLLVISDRAVNEKKAPIPALLAVGAVHHYLIRKGLRMKASLILETGAVREIHHFAVLLGYGADAINPYLAYEVIDDFLERGEIKNFDRAKAFQNFNKAVNNGVLKIMSKMGISTISSYRGAQIFEALGLGRPLVEKCFAGTSSRVGGIDFEKVAEDILVWHAQAFGSEKADRLEQGGFYRYRKDGEYHTMNPQMVKLLQTAAHSGDLEDYKKYAEDVNQHPLSHLRDLLEFRSDRKPIAVDEVEPIEELRKRFMTPGISYGALSRETHEALAIAMNRIGGLSNSGEGGEDKDRYRVRENGDSACSKIKQLASGRFGVTPEYLMSAEQFEIKIAQGSKPGEGGQLPGHKVSAEIAAVRHSTPGVTLISPPPHHDIYSIEDLAQLIYDLKMINPKAKVCVKLVSAVGVGTVAAGVVKGHADIILISGADGGTGASPLSSIKNAGMPWELGISETQQVLVLNDLRGKVLLRTDGGMKTGRDVVVACMMGAEQVGFGTMALIAAGCCMIRACHLNTCPVGVATQQEKLRAKFTGTPEDIIHYFNGIAHEVRDILASLGYSTMNDVIGRTDLLVQKENIEHAKASTLDLSPLLAQIDPKGLRPRYHVQERNDWENDKPLDDEILKDLGDAIKKKSALRLKYKLSNVNRSVGARVAGAIAKEHGDAGLPEGTIDITFRGTAGQSFGVFCIPGLRLRLIGQANDYVGKGMHGGEIILLPPNNASFKTHENVILGNTVMYGATGGTLYAAGIAGERFCVRNSGGSAVVEGGGSHMCEYMTGGLVVSLGEVGWNFGAGMTGGRAYVYDAQYVFEDRYNNQLIGIKRLETTQDEMLLKDMVVRHLEKTGSAHSAEILANWEKSRDLFWQVDPILSETKIRTEVVVNLNRDDQGRPIRTEDLAKDRQGK